MIPPRANIGLAIDGGGIRGLMVARGLAALEQELGGGSLIEQAQLKVLAGTSTGTLIAAGLAMGLTSAEIVDLYLKFAQRIFPPLLPAWVPEGLQGWIKNLIQLFRPSLYSNDALKTILRDLIAQKMGSPDFTLRQLGQRLRPDQALLITVVDITERRTHFLKSYDDHDGDWPLWQAVLASSPAPTYLPVVIRNGRYYTDGGVGSYGNPAYIVAHEAVEWMAHDPQDVTIFSFGTGWLNDVNFERAYGAPDTWKILGWARNAPFIITADAMRAESVDILQQLAPVSGQGIDLRRFQIEFTADIALDDTRDATLTRLKNLGDELAQRIHNDQHALGSAPGFDPEGLRAAVRRVDASLARAPRTTPQSK